MGRPRGLSVRLKLTLSYAAFLMVAGAGLLAAVWVFVLRYLDPDLTFRTTGLLYLRSDPLNGFAVPAAALLALLLVFGLVGGWLLAGRMLAPLARISEATRLAATGSLAHRIALPGRNDELRELADAFDGMLVRLEAHVGEQQRFAANASHELRTPLAITRTLLEVARDDRGRADDELVDRLHLVNARAIDLTEALLLLSRADQRAFVPEPVELSLAAEEAAEVLLAFAEQRGVVIETSGGAAPTSGSPALLQQVATNLLHNAIVHNLPEGGAAWIGTGADGDRVTLTVESTGPLLTPQSVSTLTEAFQRGAGRARSGHLGGAGLGLAIVRSIVLAHDGTLTLTARSGGGLRVAVELPQASGASASARKRS